jgi:hypothetical protein
MSNLRGDRSGSPVMLDAVAGDDIGRMTDGG